MDTQNDSQIETAEQIEADKQHLSEVKEDDVRASIISEFGFDPETDKERIDKAVAREIGHRKALSATIGQKIKYRELAQKAPKAAAATEQKLDPADLDKRVNDGVSKALEQRDLDAMEYPDDIKAAIKKVADINGVTVRKAEQDPYIASRIQAWKKEQGIEEATLTRNNRRGGKPKQADDGDLTPPDVDLSTEEGRKEYDKWKADQIKAGR